jgi:hypothetical protein
VITHWPATVASGQSLAIQHRDEYESSIQPQFAQAQVVTIAGIAIADAIQIGLGAVAVAQAGVASSYGTLTINYDKAQRLLTPQARTAMPGAQAATNNYSRQLFWLGEKKPGFAQANIVIEWQGNAYGEIGTPVIRKDLDSSTDWQHSSAVFNITKLDQIPPADTRSSRVAGRLPLRGQLRPARERLLRGHRRVPDRRVRRTEVQPTQGGRSLCHHLSELR